MGLTSGDLKKIKLLFDESIDLIVDDKLDRKIKEYVGNLPTKVEFYEQTDKLMKELKDTREEQAMLALHSKDHTDDIQKLKNIHPHEMHNYAMS